MRKIVILLAILCFSCNKDDNEQKYPDCVSNFIEETLNSEPGSPRAKVDKYLYQEKMVFVLQHDHSDPISVVYSESCEVLCDFGGITQENSCENWENAEYIETVWTDNR